MKKSSTLLAAICSVLTLSAASDYLKIYSAYGLWEKIKVENINDISFNVDRSIPQISVTTDDGQKTSVFDIYDISNIVYDQALPTSPLKLEVTPHHKSATFHVTSSDPSVYYRYGMFRADAVASLSDDEIEDLIMTYESDVLDALAAYAGGSITDFKNEQVFWQGDNTLECYPLTEEEAAIMPGSDYIAYLYAATITSDGLKFTHAPVVVPFTAKSLVLEPAEFQLSADINSISLTGNVSCSPKDLPFYIMAFDKEDVDSKGLSSLVSSQITDLETTVYNGTGHWADYVYTESGSRKFAPVYAGQEIVLAAVGCEYGVQTTEIASKSYTVPLPEVVDNCTFSISPDLSSKSQIKLNITPSNADTRYVVMLDKSENIDSPEYYAARKLYYYTYSRQILWPAESNDKHIFSGSQSLDSKDDIINGQYLALNTPYTFLIFGVSEDGARTTAITKYEYTPTSDSESDNLTFNIQFEKFDNSDDSYHTMNISISPSDKNAKYVVATYDYSKMWLGWDDDTFKSEWSKINGNGAYLDLQQGDYNTTLAFDSSWTGGGWSTIMFFVYGYDTPSDLYLYTINSETGAVTQLRGPGSTK
jgi:hypothetical protein